MYTDNRKYFTESTYADEAREVHKFLDKFNIPDKIFSNDGNCSEDGVNYFYLMTLNERVAVFADKLAEDRIKDLNLTGEN